MRGVKYVQTHRTVEEFVVCNDGHDHDHDAVIDSDVNIHLVVWERMRGRRPST